VIKSNNNNNNKNMISARLWLFMPVILATWETEIRKIMVGGQLREIVCKTPSSK
jgi:hypothetical protein